MFHSKFTNVSLCNTVYKIFIKCRQKVISFADENWRGALDQLCQGASILSAIAGDQSTWSLIEFSHATIRSISAEQSRQQVKAPFSDLGFRAILSCVCIQYTADECVSEMRRDDVEATQCGMHLVVFRQNFVLDRQAAEGRRKAIFQSQSRYVDRFLGCHHGMNTKRGSSRDKMR